MYQCRAILLPQQTRHYCNWRKNFHMICKPKRGSRQTHEPMRISNERFYSVRFATEQQKQGAQVPSTNWSYNFLKFFNSVRSVGFSEAPGVGHPQDPLAQFEAYELPGPWTKRSQKEERRNFYFYWVTQLFYFKVTYSIELLFYFYLLTSEVTSSINFLKE